MISKSRKNSTNENDTYFRTNSPCFRFYAQNLPIFYKLGVVMKNCAYFINFYITYRQVFDFNTYSKLFVQQSLCATNVLNAISMIRLYVIVRLRGPRSAPSHTSDTQHVIKMSILKRIAFQHDNLFRKIPWTERLKRKREKTNHTVKHEIFICFFFVFLLTIKQKCPW